jgi:hypothetical protein
MKKKMKYYVQKLRFTLHGKAAAKENEERVALASEQQFFQETPPPHPQGKMKVRIVCFVLKIKESGLRVIK